MRNAGAKQDVHLKEPVDNNPPTRKLNSRALTLIALHILLFVYSLSGLFSKNASMQPFLSFEFCALYAGMLIVLAIYAIGWQQILKRLPLTLAFANKAITVVWGIVLGALVFGETITWPMIVGAVLVIAGVVLFSIADNEDKDDAEDDPANRTESAGPSNEGGDNA